MKTCRKTGDAASGTIAANIYAAAHIGAVLILKAINLNHAALGPRATVKWPPTLGPPKNHNTRQLKSRKHFARIFRRGCWAVFRQELQTQQRTPHGYAGRVHRRR